MEEKTMFSIREFLEELDKEGVLLLLQDYMTDLRVIQQRYITISVILSLIIIVLVAYILFNSMI
ncbi:hypothetical protein IJ541_07410 [bacterium]|nr:hypothetical protein [bacterium]